MLFFLFCFLFCKLYLKDQIRDMSQRHNAISPLPPVETRSSSSYDIVRAEQQPTTTTPRDDADNKSTRSGAEISTEPRSAASSIFERVKKQARENVLLISTIISVGLGVGLGFLLREVANLNKAEIKYVGFPGEMFLRALKLIILPLISSSLITGKCGLSLSFSLNVFNSFCLSDTL